uniref:Uncharacterized protein n=1 Tax=Anopheles albimanus TaxID=7167 RepID=A0A182FYZ8_ANOAL
PAVLSEAHRASPACVLCVEEGARARILCCGEGDRESIDPAPAALAPAAICRAVHTGPEARLVEAEKKRMKRLSNSSIVKPFCKSGVRVSRRKMI